MASTIHRSLAPGMGAAVEGGWRAPDGSAAKPKAPDGSAAKPQQQAPLPGRVKVPRKVAKGGSDAAEMGFVSASIAKGERRTARIAHGKGFHSSTFQLNVSNICGLHESAFLA